MKLLWIKKINDENDNFSVETYSFYKTPFLYKDAIAFFYDAMEKYFELRPDKFLFCSLHNKDTGEAKTYSIRTPSKKASIYSP